MTAREKRLQAGWRVFLQHRNWRVYLDWLSTLEPL